MEYPEALKKGSKPVEKKPHEIEFRHVSFAYPKTDRKILDDVNIRIVPGEHLSIVGLNGAGKTTFIKLLCRLYDPTDEPTAALDPIAEYEIYKQFNSLVGGKSAFYISHRFSSCQFCDHIAVFFDGHIAEYGTHSELERIPDGIYAQMFEAQAKYYRD